MQIHNRGSFVDSFVLLKVNVAFFFLNIYFDRSLTMRMIKTNTIIFFIIIGIIFDRSSPEHMIEMNAFISDVQTGRLLVGFFNFQ
jgi:hypothetical protein